ncbi:MAG TPA: efflux RND transporter periplasmic adaptor subunit [Candidatus Accumulibacter phosphatis]|nr:MAG: Inner membrane protein YiaV precursor [Candidatus Accumulibacter sp. SK-11]HAY25956.1 HlyD family secretion protein [Accumulibacter sp.]HCN70036.1 HlyD family secretion protein [Accumulibacter sp.]HRL75862.1 efflux RND transporter periplasmic adaptor subunit [Candidatus Accumulibacter phosphatis]HRQ94089.1 efflux RND transporter periplasmic adaptor subunit [Candidatus Accumulibacter phosphatis]
MILGLLMLFGYCFMMWLIFFKLRLAKFGIPQAVIGVFVGMHLLIIFLIGLRFMTPLATEAKVIQHTIQLTPRLPQPTLLMAVLVEPNVPVKKGQPLFQFDRRMYEFQVKQLEAQLAKAKQSVLVMKTDIEVATQKVIKLKSHLEFARYQQRLSANLAKQGAGPEEDAQKWAAQVAADGAAIKEAQAEEQRAVLNYTSEINGVNTTVAAVQAELDQARLYLDNTLMVAPEDGYIMNLQARPGMVAGDYRIGAIATFVCDADRYLLANFFQENLKYVKAGQDVEAAIDLYPGQIFKGKVLAVWQGSGAGQMLPSGVLPNFQYVPTESPQGQFAVAIKLDHPDQTTFPIGTQGRAAIYANPESWFVPLRRIMLRAYSWFNWIYPFSG